jgi:hypothetical protein
MLVNIAIGVVVVLALAIAGLLLFAASKPEIYRVERSGDMRSSPDRIFGQINDFHKWTAWSPWERMDPQLKRTYSGAVSGQGAIYEWEGNKKVGKGRMEIVESSAPLKITIKLDFLQPFEAHNTAEFTLAPKGDMTKVTWAMHGRQPFLLKIMTIVFSMDKMVGKDFEAGLANLKSIVEV